MQTKTSPGWIIGLLAVIAVGAYLLVNKSGSGLRDQVKAQALALWGNVPALSAVIDRMTDSELSSLSRFITVYKGVGNAVPTSDPLAGQLQAISAKYNIFT